MCKAPKPDPGASSPELTKLKIQKCKLFIRQMNCENCTINIETTKLDYVECETCPIILCSRCDMHTNLMVVEEDCVVRCRLCYDAYRKVDNIEKAVKAVKGFTGFTS